MGGLHNSLGTITLLKVALDDYCIRLCIDLSVDLCIHLFSDLFVDLCIHLFIDLFVDL